MRYFDTSFLMPIFLAEAFSNRAEKILSQQPVGKAAISHWTRVEFCSALARQVRAEGMSFETAAEIDSAFDLFIEKSFVIVSPTTADFELARTFLRRYETGLRSADALHLAIASNHRAEAIYSLDRGLLRAGRLLGLPVSDGRQSA